MMPAISRYMTKQPLTIERHASLAQAHAVMREHHLRHLPVLDKGDLVGIVSLGDLHLLETVADFSLDEVPVDEAMTSRPYVVTSDMPLDEVAEIMATKKYGSAIIVGRDGVEGIFTTTDACRALASILQHAQLSEIAATD
jgi:acetoin utilization protein AcuB